MRLASDIAQKIIDGGGDYLLALKQNHPGLFSAVEEYFASSFEEDAEAFTELVVEETSRGRKEYRSYTLVRLPEQMEEFTEKWPQLQSIGMNVSIIERDGKERSSIRYYISSLEDDLALFARGVRQHWSIENTMHWTLDMVFNEDVLPLHNRIAVENFAFLRRFCLSLLKQDPSTGSLKGKRKKAGWNLEFLESLIFR